MSWASDMARELASRLPLSDHPTTLQANLLVAIRETVTELMERHRGHSPGCECRPYELLLDEDDRAVLEAFPKRSRK